MSIENSSAVAAKPAAARVNVTRAEVAARAGVSAAVVSYVVNGGPRPVAAATRARVEAAIAELGYRPNAAARALRLGSSELLGLVVPDNRNPFLTELAHAVEEAANKQGYSLILANAGLSLRREQRQIRHLVSRQVDGVIMVPMSEQFDASELSEAGIGLTLLAHTGSAFPSVGTDLFGAAGLALSHLLGHGYRRIGLVIGRNAGGVVDGRELAWVAALSDAALEPGPLMRAEFTREGGYEAGLSLLADGPLPEAIFTSSDMQAVGLLRALHENGVRVPEDVAVVSFDGSPESEYTWPALTTVRQPIEEMARAAVASAVALIGGLEVPSAQLFPAELLVRRSCGC